MMPQGEQNARGRPGWHNWAFIGWWWLTLCLAVLIWPSVAIAEERGGGADSGTGTVLRFGILPFSSPVALIQRFAPLRVYLGEKLSADFRLESARTFADHVLRIGRGDYDLVLTAPHFVPVALDTGEYELLAAYRSDLSAVFVVARDDPATDLDDLAGRVIGTPPAEAVISFLGEVHLAQVLAETAPAPGFRRFPSHNAAIHAIGSRLVDAAMVSVHIVRHEMEQGTPVRVLAETERIPGLGVLAHHRLPEDFRASLRETLIAMADHDEGRAVLERMVYAGYKAADPSDYERLRVFLPQVLDRVNRASGSD